MHLKQIIQLLLYYNNIFPSWKQEKQLSIFNLYRGIIYNIKINSELTNYNILKLLCDITGEKLRNLLFVYDLETTGLDTYSCDIIERHFYEYNLHFVLSSGIINIGKNIPEFITQLTGINNKMIKTGDTFSNFNKEIKELMSYSIEPKFIAHNGTNFDHKILMLRGVFNNIKSNQLLDSRYIIRMMIDSEDTNLKSVYDSIIVDKVIENYHRAKADVMMLHQILKKINFK